MDTRCKVKIFDFRNPPARLAQFTVNRHRWHVRVFSTKYKYVQVLQEGEFRFHHSCCYDCHMTRLQLQIICDPLLESTLTAYILWRYYRTGDLLRVIEKYVRKLLEVSKLYEIHHRTFSLSMVQQKGSGVMRTPNPSGCWPIFFACFYIADPSGDNTGWSP